MKTTPVLTKKDKVSRAIRVLQAIRVPKDIAESVTIKMYNNCREQGFVIETNLQNGPSYIFSENRDSDSMVLYVGTALEQGIPSQSAYLRASHFNGRRAEEELAKHISDCLKNLVTSTRRK